MFSRAEMKRVNDELNGDSGRGRYRRVSYARKYVVCGKPGCWCRARRAAFRKLGGSLAAHGPYWYAFWREKKRLRCKYVGKELHAIKIPR